MKLNKIACAFFLVILFSPASIAIAAWLMARNEAADTVATFMVAASVFFCCLWLLLSFLFGWVMTYVIIILCAVFIGFVCGI